jgi:prophage regulatory protein
MAMHRLPKLIEETGNKRATIYKQVAAGLLTKPVLISGRSVAWPAHEIEAIMRARIAGKDEHEIRSLVRKLEAARKSVDGVVAVDKQERPA